MLSTVPAVPYLAVMNPNNEIVFNDVPTGETTARAAVFRVFSCGSVTFHVTTPVGAPYVVLTSSRTVPHALVPYTEARLWFGMTGQAAKNAWHRTSRSPSTATRRTPTTSSR